MEPVEEGHTEKDRSFDCSSCLQSQQPRLVQQDHCLVQWLSEGDSQEVKVADPDQVFKGSLTREHQGSAFTVLGSYPVSELARQSPESHHYPFSIREFA